MTCTTDADCSSHGICNTQCECYNNYKGTRCEACVSDDYLRGVDGFCLIKCSGSCTSGYICQQDPDLKVSLCSCKILHADPDRACGYCTAGYHATNVGTCEPIACMKDRQLCGNQGACIETDGVYSCDCNADFTGTFCENCLNGKIKTSDGQCLPEECVNEKSKECSGQGKCDVSARDCICNHGYAGRTCQNCNVGFREYSNYYGTVCLPDNCFAPNQKEPCSTNGDCVKQGNETFCQCYSNSSGQYCQDCAAGFELLDDGYCLPDVCEVDQTDCANNGYCVVYITGFGCYCYPDFDIKTKCVSCLAGYQNIFGWCVSDVCVLNDTECNWHGYCLIADVVNSIYKCVCEAGYLGKLCNECDTANGFLSVDRGGCVKPECVANNAECSNNGICYQSSGGWKCSCNPGSTGDKCDRCNRDYVVAKDGQCVFEDCFSGNLECGGNGYCSNLNMQHKCVCNENFTIESRCVDCARGYTNNNGICTTGGNKLSGGAIAGIIIALLIIIAAICVGVWFGMKGKKGLPKITKSKTNTVPKDSDFGGKNKSGALLGSGSNNFI